MIVGEIHANFRHQAGPVSLSGGGCSTDDPGKTATTTTTTTTSVTGASAKRPLWWIRKLVTEPIAGGENQGQQQVEFVVKRWNGWNCRCLTLHVTLGTAGGDTSTAEQAAATLDQSPTWSPARRKDTNSNGNDGDGGDDDGGGSHYAELGCCIRAFTEESEDSDGIDEGGKGGAQGGAGATFASVDSVEADSPAFVAGLRVEDMLSRIGHVHAGNHSKLSAVGSLVGGSVGKVVEVTVKRWLGSDCVLLKLLLQPNKWKGQGLLGCKLSLVPHGFQRALNLFLNCMCLNFIAHSFIHSFSHSSIQSFSHSFNQSFIYSFNNSIQCNAIIVHPGQARVYLQLLY
jgi:hypothetical protein